MQGYKLCDPPVAGNLTLAQAAFVALTQSKYMEILLSPYIEKPKPSEGDRQAERRRLAATARKYAGRTDVGTQSLLTCDVTKPLYD
jgi:hypothetical protein